MSEWADAPSAAFDDIQLEPPPFYEDQKPDSVFEDVGRVELNNDESRGNDSEASPLDDISAKDIFGAGVTILSKILGIVGDAVKSNNRKDEDSDPPPKALPKIPDFDDVSVKVPTTRQPKRELTALEKVQQALAASADD
jgi:hypothetical protein